MAKKDQRPPLPNIAKAIPNVKYKRMTRADTGEVVEQEFVEQSNKFFAKRIQQALDRNEMRREFNVIADDIAQATDRLEYMAALVVHQQQVEQAKKAALERGSEEEFKGLQEVQKELNRAMERLKKPSGAQWIIEERKRLEAEKKILEATEKSAKTLEKLQKIEEERDRKQQKEFIEKGERKKFKGEEDKIEVTTTESNKQLSHLGMMLAVFAGNNLTRMLSGFTSGLTRFFGLGGVGGNQEGADRFKASSAIGNFLGRWAPLALIAGRLLIAASDVIAGWINSEKMALSKGISIIGTLLGGSEGTKTFTEIFLSTGGLGMLAVGARVGSRYGIMGTIAGALIGGALGTVMQIFGPDKMSAIVAEMTDGLLAWVDRIFGTSLRLDEESLREEAKEVEKSIEKIRRNINFQRQRVLQIQKELVEAQERTDAAEIIRLQNSLENEKRRLEQIEETETLQFKRLGLIHLHLKEALERQRKEAVESLEKAGKDLQGKDKHLVDALNKSIETKLETVDSIVNNLTKDLDEDKKKALENQVKKHTTNWWDSITNFMNYIFEYPNQFIDKEKYKWRPSMDTPPLLDVPEPQPFLQQQSYAPPEKTQRLMNAEAAVVRIKDIKESSQASQLAMVAPTHKSTSTINNISNSQTSVYHQISPYYVNDPLTRMQQLGWA